MHHYHSAVDLAVCEPHFSFLLTQANTNFLYSLHRHPSRFHGTPARFGPVLPQTSPGPTILKGGDERQRYADQSLLPYGPQGTPVSC